MKVVIVGASAAGMKAACRARRLMPDAEITVVDAGQYISYAACGLPYLLSGDIQQFDDLRMTPYHILKDPDYFKDVKGVDVRIRTKAEKIDRDTKTVFCTNTETGSSETLEYDKLVIATGSVPVRPDIPGSDLPGTHTFNTAEDAIELKKALATGQVGSVAIIGAGYIGMELTEAFVALWGAEVTLFEAENHVLPGLLDREIALTLEHYLRNEEDIEIITGARCTSVEQVDDGLKVSTSDGKHEKTFDRVIFCLGVKPESSLAAESGIKTDKFGGIVVDDKFVTSDTDIYSGGDCTALKHSLLEDPVMLPLGSIANRAGRIIADNLAGKDRRFPPVLGSSVIKAFEWNIASTGLSLKRAIKAGYDAAAVWGMFDDSAHYYPGDKRVNMTLVFDRKNGTVLGVQAAGNGNAAQRVDAAAALMKDGANLRDLLDFEHVYAPPYANPLDPLHFLAFLAENVIEGTVDTATPEYVFRQESNSGILLDVRSEDEIENHPLPEGKFNVTHVPIDELRDTALTIPKDSEVTITCMRGPRSYEAGLYLKSLGYEKVAYTAGGMLFASICKSS